MLSGVVKSVERYPRLQVISLDASLSTTPQQLDALSPSVIVLDLGVVKTEFAFALLRDHPDLLLIGMDQEGERLLVLSGQQARALTTEDLVRLIESRADLAEQPEGAVG